MKKMFLILLALITTSTNAFTADIPEISDVLKDDILKDDASIDDILTQDNLTEDHLTKPSIVDEIVKKDNIKVENVKRDTLSDKVSQINSIPNDEKKVKEWAKLSSEQNYVIINKKDCSAIVYDKYGSEIERFEVGIGREIGDDFNDTLGQLGKSKNTTPAGEFTLIPNIYNKSAYGDITLSLGSKANKAENTKKVVALHKIPKFRMKDRHDKFYDGNLANNRMSHGCINFIEKDFKEFTKYIHSGLKVYILPEEVGNELILGRNDKNELELNQTKYQKD